MPLYSRTVPLYDRTMPLYDRTMPLYNRTVPLYSRTVPLYSRAVPLFDRTVPLYSRTVPLYSRAVPLFDRTMPLYSRTVPLYSQKEGVKDRPALTSGNSNRSESVNQLCKPATEQTFTRTKTLFPDACIHRLLAIEGAIRGIRKHQLPPVKEAQPTALFRQRLPIEKTTAGHTNN